MAKTKQQKKKPTRRPKQRSRKQHVHNARGSIADCSLHYAYALTTPFAALTRGVTNVCVPDTVVIPSNKRYYMVRGVGQTGDNGYGCVYVNPYTPESGTGGARVSFSQVNTATATTTLSGYGVSANYFKGVASASQYSAEQYSVRTVAAGLRIRYMGTQLNAGGSVVAFRMPDGQNISGFSYNDVLKEPSAIVYPFGRGWTTVTWRPVQPVELTFRDVVNATDSPMGLIVSSAAANQPFYYEAIVYVEELGQVAGSTSISHSDPNGFAAAQTLTQYDFGSYQGEGFGLDYLRRKMIDVMSNMSGTVVGNIITTGARMLLGTGAPQPNNANFRIEL